MPAAAVLLCLIGSLLLRLGNAATAVLMGLLLAALARLGAEVTANTVGLLAAAFYLSELLGAPWFGAQSDRLGRKPFLVAGPVFGGVAVQLIGWPRAVPAMAAGRVIEGLSTASSVPATLSFLSAATAGDPAVRARVMAWYEMATVVGIAGGFVAGGVLWDWLGDGAFVTVTLIYAGSLAAFSFVQDAPSPAGAERPHGGLLAVLRLPRVFRFVPAWLSVNTVLGAWFIHSAFVFTGQRLEGQFLAGALGGAGLSLVFALAGLSFLVGISGWGMWMGSRPRTSVMLLTLPGAYVLCLGILGLNHIGQTGAVAVVGFAAVALAGIMVASGFTPAALAYLADISEEAPHVRGAIMGLYSVMLGLGQLAGGAIGGPFATWGGVDGLVLLTALLAGVAAATMLRLRRAEREAIEPAA